MGETVRLDKGTAGAAATVEGTSPGLTAYVARPSSSSTTGAGGQGRTWPAVVVVHEAFRVDDVMRRQADRLASAGYLAVLPDLFSAGGPVRCMRATFSALRSGHGRPFQDIEAARAFALAEPMCSGQVGIIGFCMGGAFALLAAGNGFGASSVNYGMLPKDLDAAVRDACPIVASYGGRDRGFKGAAARLEEALTRAGVEHDVKEYPKASHAFLNDAPNGPRLLRPLFRVSGMGPEPESTRDAWARIDAFFAEHLSGEAAPAAAPVAAPMDAPAPADHGPSQGS